MASSRRTDIKYIEDPTYRSATRCKRSKGLFKKVEEYHVLVGDPVALAIISPNGILRSFGKPSFGEVISECLRRQDKEELLDWAKKECDSCATKQDCTSLIMKHQVAINFLHSKRMGLENNPSVEDNAGDDSRVGAGRYPDVLNDHNLSTPLVDSAFGSESLGMDSSPMCLDPELRGLGFDEVCGQLEDITILPNLENFMTEA